MIIIKIDETKTEDIDLPVSTPENCFKCPFYNTESIDDDFRHVGWCGLNMLLGYRKVNICTDEIVDGDSCIVCDVFRPIECPLISITKEEA